MTFRAAQSLVALFLLAVLGVWAWILTIAADPGTGWGTVWFELTLTNFAVTFLAILACYVVWQPLGWRMRLARAALSVAAILLAAALIELPALVGLVDYRRVLVPRVMGGSGPHNRQLDPELVYRRLPHDHFVHQQVGDSIAGLAIPGGRRYQAECQYDANGFRNTQDFRQAEIVLLGDSFVEGYDVTQEAICAKHLADRLSAEVCNLALCGYGPYQELAALKRYGVPLQPQVVVWFFYEGKDLDDIDAYETVMGRWKEYKTEEWGYVSRSFFLNVLDPLAFWLDQRRWRPSELARRRAGQLRPEIPGNGRTFWFGGPPQAIDEQRIAQIGKLQAILASARATCDASGAKLLLVFIPRKDRVYREFCTFAADSEVPHYQFSDLPERLGAWCGEQKIEYLDLTAALKAAARRGKLVYLVDDPHWSPEGHETVAAEVAGRLEELRWLQQPRKK